MATRLSWTKPGLSFPVDGHQAILNKARTIFPSRWPPGYPEQSQEDSCFPADDHQAILNKAKTTLSQQVATRLSWTKPGGQLFPSRWPPGYPKQSQEDSSIPADGHQAILNKVKRTALSKQMATWLSWTKPGGHLFPSRWPPGYPEESQEDSSFPADGYQAILNKVKRTALPSRWPPGYPEQSQDDISFPAEGHQAILNKARRTVFPSRWTPCYHEQSQEDSSFPADDHQAFLNKANKILAQTEKWTTIKWA